MYEGVLWTHKVCAFTGRHSMYGFSLSLSRCVVIWASVSTRVSGHCECLLQPGQGSSDSRGSTSLDVRTMEHLDLLFFLKAQQARGTVRQRQPCRGRELKCPLPVRWDGSARLCDRRRERVGGARRCPWESHTHQRMGGSSVQVERPQQRGGGGGHILCQRASLDTCACSHGAAMLD